MLIGVAVSRAILIAKMIPVTDAVAKAVDFASNILNEPPNGLRLEEVELGKIGPTDGWLITLSMQHRTLGYLGRREYKVFRVSGDTGEVVSMRIRDLTHAE